MCKIKQSDTERVHVTFPGRDYPIEGMRIGLELHDEEGYYLSQTIVLEGPREKGDGIVLKRPEILQRYQHRATNRVPTDLAAQVRDLEHPRKHTADLLDVCSEGALIQTDAPFEEQALIEMRLSLPGEPPVALTGEIVHCGREGVSFKEGFRHFGVQFTEVDDDARASIRRYVHQRLREIAETAEDR